MLKKLQLSLGSDSAGSASRAPSVGPVTVVVRKYSDDGSRYVAEFAPEQAMYQLQMLHEAVPTILFELYKNLTAYAATLKPHVEEEGRLKIIMDELCSRMIFTNGEDPQNVGFVHYRVAFYVSGSMDTVKNFLLFWDSFVTWRVSVEKARPFKLGVSIKVYNCTSEAISFDKADDELNYDWSVEDGTPENDVCIKCPLEAAQPPNYRRICTIANVTVEDATHIGVVYSGDTFGFRAAMETKGIGGAYADAHGEPAARETPGAVYYRIVPTLSISEDDATQALTYFTEVVSHGFLIVRWKEFADVSPQMSAFLTQLQQCPNICLQEL